MKRLSKAERERREAQRQDSEAIKGVNAKALANLSAAAAAYYPVAANQFSVWGAAYNQWVFFNNGGVNTWGSSSNQLASPSSPSPNSSGWSLQTGNSANVFLAPYIGPSQAKSPSPPKRKLPTRRVDAPVIGYRSWHVEFPDEKRARLRATGIGLTWRGVTMRALCRTHNPMAAFVGKHRAPHETCTCGIHAYKQIHAIGLGGGELWGAVVTWGKHVEHGDEGYRAANARVIAFTYPQDRKAITPKDGRRGPLVFGGTVDYKTWVIRKLLAELAGERLGVPVVPFEKLEVYAKEFGEPLD